MITLRKALVAIANEDTGAGGIATLTGQTWPVLDETHLGDADTPRVTLAAMDKIEGTGKNLWDVDVQLNIFGHPTDDDRLAADTFDYIERIDLVRDRLVTRYSHALLLAKGVDTSPINPREGELPDEGDGTKGLSLRLRFFNAK